jgi:hypothetical protein
MELKKDKKNLIQFIMLILWFFKYTNYNFK